jgi:6-phosphogluconate dehydrogenase
VNTIAEVVFARSASGHVDLRAAAQKALIGPNGAGSGAAAAAASDRQQLVDDVRAALWSAKVVAYAQGLDQIRAAGLAYGWDIDIAGVAKIWRGGCIIRARLLERIRAEYAAENLTTLLAAPSVAAELARSQNGWRATVTRAIDSGVPVPGFSAALAYYDTVRAQRLPAALVQGLRDFFGAHTYRRTDVEGSYHTEWSGDRSQTRVDV